jgi:hypothetical protein
LGYGNDSLLTIVGEYAGFKALLFDQTKPLTHFLADFFAVPFGKGIIQIQYKGSDF